MTEIEATLDAPGRAPSAVGSTADAPLAHELVIRPSSGWRSVNWGEMYKQRELLFFLIWRDLTTRYKQTILGPAWAILQPVIMMGIFTILSRMTRVPIPNAIPTPVFIFAALIPWTMFNQAFSGAAMSLVNQLNMVTKVYFPRLFLPITAGAVYLVDGVLATAVYALMLFAYGIVPQWTVVFLPLLYVLTVVAALGLGIFMASLMLFYRDFKHIVPFMVQIMMYTTPIFFSASLVPDKYRWIASLNPIFGIAEAYRSAILGTPMFWGSFLISTTSAVVLFFFSTHYFRRNERLFADFV